MHPPTHGSTALAPVAPATSGSIPDLLRARSLHCPRYVSLFRRLGTTCFRRLCCPPASDASRLPTAHPKSLSLCPSTDGPAQRSARSLDTRSAALAIAPSPDRSAQFRYPYEAAGQNSCRAVLPPPSDHRHAQLHHHEMRPEMPPHRPCRVAAAPCQPHPRLGHQEVK